MQGVFVTGTDTNVGKTLLSAWLCLHTRAAYWKPIQAGIAERDRDTVQAISNVETVAEAYCLQLAASPHQAAAAEDIEIDLKLIQLPAQQLKQGLVVEGAGGVFVPLNPQQLLIDLIVQLQLPVLVVARSGLGTLNHTLLTLQALRARQVPVLGVLMNGEVHAANRQAIEHYGNTTVLAEFTPLTTPQNVVGPGLTTAQIATALQARPLPEQLVRVLATVGVGVSDGISDC